MPKSREARDPHCSFCGEHKDDVPLIIQSNTTTANVCCNCALRVVEQAFVWMGRVDKRTRQLMAKRPNPQKIVMPEDRKDVAIGKANGKGRRKLKPTA
jgi:hypothetical protein